MIAVTPHWKRADGGKAPMDDVLGAPLGVVADCRPLELSRLDTRFNAHLVQAGESAEVGC